jgi:phage terminase large subunit
MRRNIWANQDAVARRLLERSPRWFIEKILGNPLWEKQLQVAQAVATNKRITVRSCHGAGKTFAAANIGIWHLLAHPDSIVITTAPTFRQVEDVLWREMRQLWAKCPWAEMFGATMLTTRLELSEKWYATGISTDEPDKLQGIHAPHVLVIVDEAAGVEEGIFEAIEGIISSEGAKLLLIGNPTNLAGTFYNSFRDPAYIKVHISANDVPNVRTGKNVIPGLISREWVQEMKKQWGEDNPIYQARVLGEFPEQGTDTLIPLNKIEAAVDRKIAEDQEGEVTAIGADIARYGTDKTVFVARRGNTVVEIKKHSMKDTMETVGMLFEFMRRHGFPTTRIDEIGVGAGVLDRLREMKGAIIEGINVGASAHDTDQFRNKRAELYWKLREKFMENQIAIPDDPELMSQLARIKYKFSSTGVQMESKDEMRKRGLASPDVADALSLCFMPTYSVSFRYTPTTDPRYKPLTAGYRNKVW